MRPEELTADAVIEAAAKIGFRLKLGLPDFGKGRDKKHGCAVDVTILAADSSVSRPTPADGGPLLGLPAAALVGLGDGFEGKKSVPLRHEADDPKGSAYRHAHAVGVEVRRRVLAGEGANV
jgi:hypothetical protein